MVSDPSDLLQAWLGTVLAGLVDDPDIVQIEKKNDDMGVLFTISSTNKKDVGALIGKKGEHVNALRVLLRTCGHAHKVKASLKIVAE